MHFALIDGSIIANFCQGYSSTNCFTNCFTNYFDVSIIISTHFLQSKFIFVLDGVTFTAL
jgi:hypothetical protein